MPNITTNHAITYTNVLSDIFFCFTQFSGSFHWLNFDKFCDTAPSRFKGKCKGYTLFV